MIDKSRIFAALLSQLETDLELQTQAALMARDEATNEESRAESKWDTRGQEAAYLAEGQAKIAGEIKEAIGLFRELADSLPPTTEVVSLGSVVVIEQPGTPFRGVIGPRAGGTAFTVDDVTFIVITLASPIGRELLGKRIGDSITMRVQRKPHHCNITELY